VLSATFLCGQTIINFIFGDKLSTIENIFFGGKKNITEISAVDGLPLSMVSIEYKQQK
jgi:hypothetical protein